jgi:hypothetical protein
MTTTPVFEKSIRYDWLTRDYAMYCDGQLVGFAATHHDAEVALNQHVLELIQSGITATASALDGGQAEAVNWSDRGDPVEADPDDAEGDDCPEHGPYPDEECPKCQPVTAAAWPYAWPRPKCYQRFALHTGRSHRRRTRRSRKTQLAYLLMCYRVAHVSPPSFLRADFVSRNGL